VKSVALLAIPLLVSCGINAKNKASDPSTPAEIEMLRSAFEEKSAEYVQLTDATYGWPSLTDCDGVLWAGEACAAGLPVKISLAEYKPGEIHRRPAPACWNKTDGDVGSKTTVSRDSLTGYLACISETNDVPAMKRLAEYGEKNKWIMGSPGTEPRTWMQGNLTGLLGRMLEKNGVKKSYSAISPNYLSVKADYERHIQALGIYLQGETSGGISDQMLERLEELRAVEPDNAFFAAIGSVYTGDPGPALGLLLDEETPRPTYVRGGAEENFARSHWLLASRILLKHQPKEGVE
jgi:hypothetical protein